MTVALVRPLRRLDPVAATLSLLFASFTVVGYAYHQHDDARLITGAPPVALAAVGIIAVPLYLLISGLYSWLDRRRSFDAPAPRVSWRRRFWSSFGIVSAGWLPWLLVHFPGSVDSDTITQKFQWLGLSEQTDHHPWFDTAVFGFFWNIGEALGDANLGLLVYLALQVLATAAGAALVIAYLVRLGLATAPWLVMTMLVAVTPVLVASPSVMSKDTLAAVFWLPFLVLFTEALRTRGTLLLRPGMLIAFTAIMFPLVLSKRTNVYLIVLCAIVLLVVAMRGSRWRVVASVTVALVVTQVIWPLSVLGPLGIGPGSSTDMMTVPVQQTARIVATHGHEIPVDEREVIDAVLRYDGLAEAYVPRRSDNVKGRWNNDATLEQKLAYWRVWATQALRYPGTAIAATVNNTYEYFAPVSSVTFQRDLDLERYVDFWDSRTLESTSRDDVEQVSQSLQQPESLSSAREGANAYYDLMTEGNVLASKAWFSSWIPLLALGFAIRNRNLLRAAATVPLFINLAFLVASPVALPRYILPMIYGSILAVGLLLVRFDARERELTGE